MAGPDTAKIHQRRTGAPQLTTHVTGTTDQRELDRIDHVADLPRREPHLAIYEYLKSPDRTPAEAITELNEDSKYLGAGASFAVRQISVPGLEQYCLRAAKQGNYETPVNFEFRDPFPEGNVGQPIARGLDSYGRAVVQITRFQPGQTLLQVLRETAESDSGHGKPQTHHELYTAYFERLAAIPQADFNALAREIKALTRAGGTIDSDNTENLLIRETSPRFGLVDVNFTKRTPTPEKLADPEFMESLEYRNSLDGMLGLLLDRQKHLTPLRMKELPEPLARAQAALVSRIVIAAQAAGLPIGNFDGEPSVPLQFALSQSRLGERYDEIIRGYQARSLTPSAFAHA